MDDITVGLRAPYDATDGPASLAQFVAQVEATGIDRVCVGDHVAFKGGRGFDGLVNATALAVASRRVTVQTAVYLLPLRHPVPVARQVASLAALAPGRLSFGVGTGGEDRTEFRACGIDPASRGRRMNEALTVLRPLLAGKEVTASGDFFNLDHVCLRPAPVPEVPIVIGGRSDAALRRVAHLGDGWLGLWVSAQRFRDATARISLYAAEAERPVSAWQHGIHVWCAFGTKAEAARARLAVAMEDFYQTPFSKFERYCPCGMPQEIAEGLRPYLEAGCRSFNLVPLADNLELAIEGADAVKTALRRMA
jgi:alkanesulfonate monooxygenase SsuD/methylene tetrahydromethanopterin reductase-like flavin-dependent oxidoreductase (luciferase family)